MPADRREIAMEYTLQKTAALGGLCALGYSGGRGQDPRCYWQRYLGERQPGLCPTMS